MYAFQVVFSFLLEGLKNIAILICRIARPLS